MADPGGGARRERERERGANPRVPQMSGLEEEEKKLKTPQRSAPPLSNPHFLSAIH